MPRWRRRNVASPRSPWRLELPEIPAALLTTAGISRDRSAELAAFNRQPLQDFHQVYEDAIIWETKEEWASFLPEAPRLAKAYKAVERSKRATPQAAPAITMTPEELTMALRDYAASLGLGAIGVAEYDEKYTFEQHKGHQVGDRIVICLLEQHYEATQQTPSVRTNHAAYHSEAEVTLLAVELADFLRTHGYRARGHMSHEAAMINYGVEAGLGQLGLNGQLLTPATGSRCRLGMLSTDAPLVLDRPVDYGIQGICDACQACVRRCPVGAIPAKRRMYRGIEKAKINTSRCFPTVAQTSGCGVCMKVCPIQRYGLSSVLEEFERSGEILGHETDELEGYDWPLDGRHYSPGEKPRLPRQFFQPPGFDYQPKNDPVYRHSLTVNENSDAGSNDAPPEQPIAGPIPS